MVVDVITLIVLLATAYLLIRPIVRGAIFFPSSVRNVEVMMNVASLRRGDRIADLGSGDGRILIACAQQGIRAEGYEINPILVFLSRRAIRKARVEHLAAVHWKSFWRVDLAPFDTVFVYGMDHIMGGLQKKLEHELRLGTKVIANVFPFPGWTPAAQRGNVYLYERS